MTIELRRYRPADREMLFAFLRRHFSSRDDAAQRAVWTWRYENNPFERAGPCVFVAYRGGELVGHIATMAVPLAVDGRVFEARWAVDLIVDPSTRGSGLGTRLIQAWIDASQICLGKGVSESADKIYRKMGWLHVDLLPVRVVATSARAVVGRRTADPRITALANATTRWAGGLWLRWHARDRADLEFRRESAAPAVLDELAQRLAALHRITLVRDQRYVRWRYFEHPLVDYHLITAWRDGEPVGFATISVQRSRGFTRGIIHDLQLAIAEPRAQRSFIAHCARELQALGGDEVTILPRNAIEDRIVKRMGGVQRPSPIMILYDNSGQSPDLAGASQSLDVQLGDSDGW